MDKIGGILFLSFYFALAVMGLTASVCIVKDAFCEARRLRDYIFGISFVVFAGWLLIKVVPRVLGEIFLTLS